MGRRYTDRRALVIEDQAFTRKVVVMALRQLGFSEVAEAADGADGLAEIERRAPDVVICDIEMQPVDGLVFLQTLRAEHGDGIPVLFLTQHGEALVVERARALGVSAFLLKPPSLQALRQRLDLLLPDRH